MTYQRQTHELLLRAISHGAWQRLKLKWLFNTGYEPPRCPVALGKAAVQEPSVRLIPANQRSVEPSARAVSNRLGVEPQANGSGRERILTSRLSGPCGTAS